MSNIVYINRVSGTHKREIYEGGNNPPHIPGFDTWLHLKALNLKAGYPWVSFNSSIDFIGNPHPYSVTVNGKSIPGYYITFKHSALSTSPTNMKNYMRITTNYVINLISDGITIFFPKSAYYGPDMSTQNLTKIYVDGPRPTHSNPYLVADYDTWINMSSLGGKNPWVAFNKAKDLISAPPPDLDTKNFSGYAIRFKSTAISDSNQGMKDPVEVYVTQKNVTKNPDGSITITIPKNDYLYTGLRQEINVNMDDINGQTPIQVPNVSDGPYLVNLHMWI
jgi:hypothetical protein